MTNQVVEQLMIWSESYCWDLRRVEVVNVDLLRRMAALEHGQGNLILVPDSPEPIPVPPLVILGLGSVLAEINDRVDNKRNQAIAED